MTLHALFARGFFPPFVQWFLNRVVLCSHHDCAVCAWDVRNLVYPVHEGRLDHRAESRQHFVLGNALWRAPNQAMSLSCSYDTMLGHAANGTPVSELQALQSCVENRICLLYLFHCRSLRSMQCSCRDGLAFRSFSNARVVQRKLLPTCPKCWLLVDAQGL